jgi:HSP20 family protein
MNITPVNWNPAREFGLVPGRLWGLADSFFRDSAGSKAWTPAVEVTEDEKSYVVHAELPDVKNEDVKVVVRDGVLTLKGERKSEKKSEGTKYLVSEFSYGSFSRSFSLPKDADADKVVAGYKNGVLTVTLPKKAEVQPKEIEVKVH